MALTATQQLQLIKGAVKPPSNDLLVLVHQTALIKAKQMYDGYKVFNTETFPLATNYLNKMLNVADQVFRKQGDVIPNLRNVIVTIIGNQAFTYAQIQAADDAAWEAFLLDQMDEAFEYLGAVRKEEKTQYTGI